MTSGGATAPQGQRPPHANPPGMRILSRYILREHLAPFVFAACALTFVLLLNEVSQRFDQLLGKGLEAGIILEIVGLSIPYIVAMSLPMAVLIAVLYTFNRLAGDNEITAMKASGLHMPRLLGPVVLVATLLAGGMVWFNDRVLPEANHMLQQRLTEVAQKKPTFSLSPRTMNEVIAGELYLQAGQIDRTRSTLSDVQIYDERNPVRSRTVYADSGHMAYSQDRTDLYLTLYDGVTHTYRKDEPASYQRIFFREDVMVVEGVSNVLERNRGSDYRGDREMSIGQMRTRVDSARRVERAVRGRSQAFAVGVTRELTLAEGAGIEGEAGDGADGGIPDGLLDELFAGDSARAAAVLADSAARAELEEVLASAAGVRSAGAVVSRLQSHGADLSAALSTRNRFAVEIQKKYAIPVACIVFVLIGAPIAVRYPLGGVGMVVGVSFGFFCAYYVSLVGGEELADRLILSPFWAMWAPNVLFGGVGLGFVWRAVKAG